MWTLTGNSEAFIRIDRESSALAIELAGTWSGSINFLGSVDGQTWEPLAATPILPSGGPAVTAATANGTWEASVAGLAAVQIVGGPIDSGAAIVTANSTSAPIASDDDDGATFYTPTPGSAAYAVAKASPGRLRSFVATNRSGVTLYAQFFDSAVPPSNDDLALVQYLVPPGPGSIGIGTDIFLRHGVRFGVGIAWGFSTTSGFFTAPANGADCDFSAVLS